MGQVRQPLRDVPVRADAPRTGGDRETVLGDEAHIVGERPSAARYRRLPEHARNAYENRILLCPMSDSHYDNVTVRVAPIVVPETFADAVLSETMVQCAVDEVYRGLEREQGRA